MKIIKIVAKAGDPTPTMKGRVLKIIKLLKKLVSRFPR
jgi:hypothetical protein